MATTTAALYRRPLLSPGDDLFHRCLSVSAAFGVTFLIVMLLSPVRERVITQVEQLPPRFAKLIVQPAKPKPLPALPKPRALAPSAEEAPAEAQPAAPATPKAPVTAPARAARPPGPVGGAAGRTRAQTEIASTLASSTRALSRSLEGLSSSLQSTGAPTANVVAPRRRSRGIRSGRTDLPAMPAATAFDGGGSADLGGSAVKGSLVAIGDLASAGGGGGGGGNSGGGGSSGTGGGGAGTGSGSGSAPGVYRSNASLLAVIQKYAAGIQYCYGNELKRDSSLRGKLVVAITVSASGDVTEATVMQNTTGSQRLASCSLSQIRDWKFPPIEGGATTFQAPFVFTPPS